jgi:phosphinothricin acetyltransferase
VPKVFLGKSFILTFNKQRYKGSKFFLHLTFNSKMEKIELRPYKSEDTPAIVEIINYNILTSTALYDYIPRSLAQQLVIFEEKTSKNFPIVVACIDNKVVGFGYYSEFRFREAYRFTVEHSVYVSNDFQGKGIGKLLLTKLITLAKEQKLHTMIAVIDAENENSIAFHEQFGFTTVGIIKESGYKFDRWLHSVIMQLMLE